MGWVINIGTDMVQFMIKISAVNASADVKTDIPSNFEDFDAKHFETLSTISTHFVDFNKMGLETQEELDELVGVFCCT